jgi:serine/threonine-protein kinase
LNAAPVITPPPPTSVPSSSRRKPREGRSLPSRLGRHTLFERIGHGGMANIYLARSRTELGARRLCVIKEVLPELAHDGRFAELLVAEAKLSSRLSHVNVVKIEDLGREDNSLFIAMEYVEGLDLRELLRRAAALRVPMPVSFSLIVIADVLRGLDYAHRLKGDNGKPLGIVHRDVSPSNVLVSFEGEVKLCDFGIARASAASGKDSVIEGKAGYMSPEQARGEAVDARSDVFAAGIMLWELIAGRRLYKAQPGERLLEVAQRAQVPPLPARGLPQEEELGAIVMRALSPCREDRYPTAGAMLRDIERYAVEARMIASPIRFGEWLRDHFGAEILAERRSRQRAIEALERGPAAILKPITSDAAPPDSGTRLKAGHEAALQAPQTPQSNPTAPTKDGPEHGYAVAIILLAVTMVGTLVALAVNNPPPLF